jgi:glycosyltransferase involved in cell wall biosynthesis
LRLLAQSSIRTTDRVGSDRRARYDAGDDLHLDGSPSGAETPALHADHAAALQIHRQFGGSGMRILHVLVSMDPAQGGPPAVASRLAAAEAAAGHDVSIACHESPGRSQAIEASLRGIPHIDLVRLVNLSPRLVLRAAIPRETRLRMRDLLQNVDVLHLHGIWEPIVRKAAALARSLGVPYLITPHGMLDPWSLRQRWLKKKIALALGYRRMLQQAGCLHLLNEDERELIKPLKLRCPMRVIPNGVFLEEIEPLPAAGTFRTDRPELRNDPYILFLSRLHYKKGLDVLAEAFSTLAKSQPSARLVVAGPDGGSQAEFEDRIVRLGLSDRTHVVGPLYGREKFAAMVDAACFCLPSRQEGFSMAITEAMACGCPVVITEACHFPEVQVVGAGQVVPLEPSRVAAALDHMLTDSSRRSVMSQAGRRLVLDYYVWPEIARKAVDAYQMMLGRSTKGIQSMEDA